MPAKSEPASVPPRKVRLVIDSPNPSPAVNGYRLWLKADPADPHKVTITLGRYNVAKSKKLCQTYDNESVFVMTAEGPFGFYVQPENRDLGPPRTVGPGELISKLTMPWSPKPQDRPEQFFTVSVHQLHYHTGSNGHPGSVTGGGYQQPQLKFHYEYADRKR